MLIHTPAPWGTSCNVYCDTKWYFDKELCVLCEMGRTLATVKVSAVYALYVLSEEWEMDLWYGQSLIVTVCAKIHFNLILSSLC